jgi:hypothetical protein
MVRNIGIAFSVLITLAFGYGIYEALSYAYLAKIFPLYVSLVLCIVAIVNLIQEFRTSQKGTQTSSTGSADLGTEWGDIAFSEVLRKFLVFILVILGLYGCIWLIGYPLSITAFIIILYRYLAGTKWHWALAAGLCGLGFLALVSKLLYMDWPQGLIKLPWPLG